MKADAVRNCFSPTKELKCSIVFERNHGYRKVLKTADLVRVLNSSMLNILFSSHFYVKSDFFVATNNITRHRKGTLPNLYSSII